MLYRTFSGIVDSSEVLVAPGAVFVAEGQAAVRQRGATAAGVMPSTGTSADVFAGFVIAGTSAAPFPTMYNNKVEKRIVPSTGTVTLNFTPIVGQVFVFDNTAGAAVADPTVSNKNVSGLTAGNEVTITYRYELSYVQSVALQGNVQPGGYAGAYVGQIGLIKRGTIYTSEYDASVDWNAVSEVKLGANGQVTGDAGTGVAINAVVIAVPTTEVSFLGLEFSAPAV